MDEILINNGFKLFASLFLAMGLFILNSFKNELKDTKTIFGKSLSEIKDSVADLNVHIAQLIEKDLTKSERLNHHEKTLHTLDNKLTTMKDNQYDKLSDLHTEIALIKQKIIEIEQDIA